MQTCRAILGAKTRVGAKLAPKRSFERHMIRLPSLSLVIQLNNISQYFEDRFPSQNLGVQKGLTNTNLSQGEKDMCVVESIESMLPDCRV
jgi:hypothetical protein